MIKRAGSFSGVSFRVRYKQRGRSSERKLVAWWTSGDESSPMREHGPIQATTSFAASVSFPAPLKGVIPVDYN